MAGTRLKVFVEEVLAYADLNAEFDNILSTNDQNIGTPRSTSWDMNAQELVMDANQNTSITADTDDRIDFELGGVDLFRMDGTTAGCDSGFDFIGSDLSGGNGDPSITVVSTETNCSLNIVPKAAGDLQVNGGSMSPLAWQVYGA